MTTIVRIITSSHPAAVMSYPRDDGGPVEGGQFTEIAQVPPNGIYDAVVHAGQDVLVIEMPLPDEAEAAPADHDLPDLPPFQHDGESEADVSGRPTALLREAS